MKHYTITKANFLKWYYNTGDDQMQIDQATKLGFSVIYALIDKGECNITADDIWDECEKSCIPLKYTEEDDFDSDQELGELEHEWTIQLI